MPSPTIRFDRRLIEFDDALISRLWRECTPKILVVTDTLNFGTAQGFGLTQFVNSLRASTIHGMTPIVTTASRYGSVGADLTNFKFNDATHGLAIGRYDVLFLLGAATEGVDDLANDPAQLDAIKRFMQAGGGVFATGDHSTLGAALCGDIPRVRGMRKWKIADGPPTMADQNRHSTNLSGDDETEEFSDQSDVHAQRLYLNFRTVAGGTAIIDRLAHPLAQMVGKRRVLEVFPDHPHEGECRVPAALSGTFAIDGAHPPEWPRDAAGAEVWPEIVGYTVSHGDGFPTGPTGPKEALVPKLFAAICAWDGQRGSVGRVVTDATWHHFVNINLDGTGSGGLTGLQSPAGVDTEALVRIRRYYVNLATWLMPKKVRRCLRWPLVIKELQRFPLFEELDLPRPPDLRGPVLARVGESLVASLSSHLPPWEAQTLAEDALEDALGPEQAAKLLARGGEVVAGLRITELSQAALGGLLTGMALELESLDRAETVQPHKTFEARAREMAQLGVNRLLEDRRAELRRLEDFLDTMAQASKVR